MKVEWWGILAICHGLFVFIPGEKNFCYFKKSCFLGQSRNRKIRGIVFWLIDDILISRWHGMNIQFVRMGRQEPTSTEQIGNQTVKTNYKRDKNRSDRGVFV